MIVTITDDQSRGKIGRVSSEVVDVQPGGPGAQPGGPGAQPGGPGARPGGPGARPGGPGARGGGEGPGPGLAGRPGYLLQHVCLRLGELTTAALAPYDLIGRELAVLLVLASGEPASQQDAARRLGVDRTTMVGLVDAL